MQEKGRCEGDYFVMQLYKLVRFDKIIILVQKHIIFFLFNKNCKQSTESVHFYSFCFAIPRHTKHFYSFCFVIPRHTKSGRMDELGFYVLFNSISVISRRWKGPVNMKGSALNRRLGSGRILPPAPISFVLFCLSCIEQDHELEWSL